MESLSLKNRLNAVLETIKTDPARIAVEITSALCGAAVGAAVAAGEPDLSRTLMAFAGGATGNIIGALGYSYSDKPPKTDINLVDQLNDILPQRLYTAFVTGQTPSPPDENDLSDKEEFFK